MLKFKLRKEVRRSVADNIIRAAWHGAAIFAATGFVTATYWVSVGVVIWWFTFQIIGHMIMNIEDIDDDK